MLLIHTYFNSKNIDFEMYERNHLGKVNEIVCRYCISYPGT